MEHIQPAVDFRLQESRDIIAALCADSTPPTWQNFIEPLEEIDNKLYKTWGPVEHLEMVMNSDEWHEVYVACLQKMTQYRTEVGQNQDLYNKFKAIEGSSEYAQYDLAQKKVIENALLRFTLSGIALDETKQKTFKELSQSLSRASSQFGNHVLKSTQSWFKHIQSDTELAGLPEASMGLLNQLAQQRDLEGWCVTLDVPSFQAVMTYADNRSLRQEVYRAFATRASDQFDDPQFDNSALIDAIRKDRHTLANLIGFNQYADYSLADKMAPNTQEVLGFLNDLVDKSKAQAEQELEVLKRFASEQLDLADLQVWDVSYASEKLKSATLNISQETLRPYFPIETVLNGMFTITDELFGIKIEPEQGVSVWHEDVRVFKLMDENNTLVGHFYLDLYARENKRGGAWMDSVVTRWRHPDGSVQTPIAYLVCNFTPPIGDREACLTHDELTTLFHEFGHGIHHLFTKMERLDIAGINGVPWDAVELPSQFMENFCWEKEGLNFISSHTDTGEPLPIELLERLKRARGFQSAMGMLRQLQFGLMDFELHSSFDPDQPEPILALSDRIRDRVAIMTPPEYSRALHSFSHIFAGGYAAGYYSYKWAEVLSADAFSLFEEEGILNPDIGAKFKNTILAAGGSVDPMVLFKAFRGREPTIDALLRHSGIH